LLALILPSDYPTPLRSEIDYCTPSRDRWLGFILRNSRPKTASNKIRKRMFAAYASFGSASIKFEQIVISFSDVLLCYWSVLLARALSNATNSVSRYVIEPILSSCHAANVVIQHHHPYRSHRNHSRRTHAPGHFRVTVTRSATLLAAFCPFPRHDRTK